MDERNPAPPKTPRKTQKCLLVFTGGSRNQKPGFLRWCLRGFRNHPPLEGLPVGVGAEVYDRLAADGLQPSAARGLRKGGGSK